MTLTIWSKSEEVWFKQAISRGYCQQINYLLQNFGCYCHTDGNNC